MLSKRIFQFRSSRIKYYSFKYKVTVVNNCKGKLSPQYSQLHLHSCNFLPIYFQQVRTLFLVLKIKIYISDLIWVTKKENQQQLQRNYQEMWEQAALEKTTLSRLSPMKVKPWNRTTLLKSAPPVCYYLNGGRHLKAKRKRNSLFSRNSLGGF